MPPIRRSYKRLRRFIAANGEICTLLTIGRLFLLLSPRPPSLSLAPRVHIFYRRVCIPDMRDPRDLASDAYNYALNVNVF